VFAPQLVSDVGERGCVHLTVAEAIGLLTTPWLAEPPTSVRLDLVAAHRAGRQRLAIVTRIVIKLSELKAAFRNKLLTARG